MQDGNGQFELNWDYDDCLATADKHVFFKFMAKSVAEKHGKVVVCLYSPSVVHTCFNSSTIGIHLGNFA